MKERDIEDGVEARLRRCGNRQEVVDAIHNAKLTGFLIDSGLASQALLHELWVSHCSKENIPVCWARNTVDGYEFYISTHNWTIPEKSLKLLSEQYSRKGKNDGYKIYCSGTVLIKDIFPERFQEATSAIISKIGPA